MIPLYRRPLSKEVYNTDNRHVMGRYRHSIFHTVYILFQITSFFPFKKKHWKIEESWGIPHFISLSEKKKRDSFTGSFSAIAMGMWTINGAAPFYGWLSYGASYKNGWQMGYPILGTHHITKISPTCFLGGHWTVVKWMIREQRGLSK